MNSEILTPAVTIFDNNNNIDYDGNKKMIEYLIKGGVDGIVPLGSSGEFPSLMLEERKNFIKFYIQEVNARVDLIPGTGAINILETIELSNYALELGVRAVLIIAPYYYALDQNKIFNYYNILAKKLKGNMYIYNFPARTGHDISAETVYRLLKENKNIIGMKDTTDYIPHTKSILLKVKDEFPKFEVYSGYDDHFMPNLIAGGKGCIGGLSNVFPDLWSDWIKAVNNKDFEKYIKIEEVINELMQLYSLDSNFPYLFKRIIKYLGLDINTTTTFPFNSIDEVVYQKAIKIVNDSYLKYKKGEYDD